MVKVLVATREAQGLRHDDVAAAVEGELVYVPVDGCLPSPEAEPGCEPHVFSEDSPTPDSPTPDSPGAAVDAAPSGVCLCGCRRSFVGMASNRGTTTALVVERGDLRPDDLWTALQDSLERQGHPSPMASEDDFRAFRLLFRRTLATAAHFRAGSIIERQGSQIRRRAQTEPLAIPIDLIGGEA